MDALNIEVVIDVVGIVERDRSVASERLELVDGGSARGRFGFPVGRSVDRLGAVGEGLSRPSYQRISGQANAQCIPSILRVEHLLLARQR